MFSDDDYNKLVKDGRITREVAQTLLSLYVAEIDWWPHVVTLHGRFQRKYGDVDANEMIKKAIAFTILLPAFDRSAKIDDENPQNLLFWGITYHQFGQRDWFAALQKVAKEDRQILDWRREVLQLGIIDPIDYQPYTRQAFSWLCDKVTDSGIELTEELKGKYRKLVMAYGGSVVSYVFEKHGGKVKKVVNWRSPYFFERQIYKAYDLDQIIRIKQTELRKTNQKLVKTVRKG